MKTVLFVPGYQEDLTTRNYTATIAAIERQGYSVRFIPITWSRATIDQWVEELDAVYSTYDPHDTILAGFSYGAMTAFVSAIKRNPSELWLFSLSPYFSEDIANRNMRTSWLKNIGHRRVAAFNALNFKELSAAIKCKTLLFAGQLEIEKWPIIGERTAMAHALLKNNKLTIVDGAGHDVADEQYVAAIERAIQA